MRNLVQYPIIRDEVIEFFKHLQLVTGFENTQLVGDIGPSIVEALLHLLQTNDDFWKVLEKEMRV